MLVEHVKIPADSLLSATEAALGASLCLARDEVYTRLTKKQNARSASRAATARARAGGCLVPTRYALPRNAGEAREGGRESFNDASDNAWEQKNVSGWPHFAGKADTPTPFCGSVSQSVNLLAQCENGDPDRQDGHGAGGGGGEGGLAKAAAAEPRPPLSIELRPPALARARVRPVGRAAGRGHAILSVRRRGRSGRQRGFQRVRGDTGDLNNSLSQQSQQFQLKNFHLSKQSPLEGRHRGFRNCISLSMQNR